MTTCLIRIFSQLMHSSFNQAPFLGQNNQVLETIVRVPTRCELEIHRNVYGRGNTRAIRCISMIGEYAQ